MPPGDSPAHDRIGGKRAGDTRERSPVYILINVRKYIRQVAESLTESGAPRIAA